MVKKTLILIILIPILSGCYGSNSDVESTTLSPQTVADNVQVGDSYFCPQQTFAICNKATCSKTATTDQDGIVSCSCKEIPLSYTLSPVPCDTLGQLTTTNNLISTYTTENMVGSYAYKCTNKAYADCFGAICTKNGSNVTCACPYFTENLINTVIISDAKTSDPSVLCGDGNIRSATAASSWGSPAFQKAGNQIGIKTVVAPLISNP